MNPVKEQLETCGATFGPHERLNLGDIFKLCAEIKKCREEMAEKERKWLDDVMRTHLPDNIYRWAHSKIPFALRKASEYLTREGFELQYTPDGRMVIRNGRTIGKWYYSIRIA